MRCNKLKFERMYWYLLRYEPAGQDGYPQFANDLLHDGAMDASKCCIACGKCTELMRAGSMAGCVVRDPEYLPIYRRDVQGK